ncbi:Protein of unknown function (DUF3540) [Polaromonas sp. CF318]|uniref:DUF3540 domain-containing protein n=1 Tax=Polaromonas sp. CF318 TaxID=1144318 RepID=UPI00027100BE|nr:DUF3540 domain-containing protein [Polaromonas sp. CF318]EJL88813.1 Protein of unknown function (DUF3540) [Polaromonas sp. CF318]
MQNNLIPMARPGVDPAVTMVYATVTGRVEKWVFLSTADASVSRALRADGCLVEPECGDTVLVCGGGATTPVAYVLAVLARAEAKTASLILPGGVALCTDQGNLSVDACKVELNASHSVALHAPAIEMAGLTGDMKFHRLTSSVREVQARFGIVNTVAQEVTSAIGRLVQKTRDSFRWTENVDETRAGRMRLQVEERLHVTAKHATVLAEGQVKIDGEKIDLG